MMISPIHNVSQFQQIDEDDPRIAAPVGERRSHDRITFRSLVTAVVKGRLEGESQLRMISAWSVDLSDTGAALVTTQPLEGGHLYVRFLVPWAGTQCLSCEIVHVTTLRKFHGKTGTFYRYGVRFLKLLTEAEFGASMIDVSSSRNSVDERTANHH